MQDEDTKFWTWFRSGLRRLSQRYPPIYATLHKAKRPYNGPNKRQKVCYECAECHGLFSSKEVAVDHIEAAGSLRCKEDVADFVDKLFCGEDGLQVLCKQCHDIKSYCDKYDCSKEYAIAAKDVAVFKKLGIKEMKQKLLTIPEICEIIPTVKQTKKAFVELFTEYRMKGVK